MCIVVVSNMESLLSVLQSATPVGVMAMLAYIIYILVKGKVSVLGDGQARIADNHLHGLPEMLELLRSQNATLERMERQQEGNYRALSEAALAQLQSLEYIKARVNGGPR